MLKLVGLVQVHMDSKRLPGKAMAEIMGRSMTWHIVNRLQYARLLDEVVVALTDEESDEPIRSMARAEAIPYYAGSESDLIDRIYQTALKFEADAIVRITGDCPLVDPAVVDHLVSTYLERPYELDYVSNVRPATFPTGIGAEVYPTATLLKLWQEIRNPLYREWFPVYFWENEADYWTANVENSQNISHLRWTVDYKEDLEFVRRVYGRLYSDQRIFGMADVLELLAAEPDVALINSMYPCDNGFGRALDAYNTYRAGQDRPERQERHRVLKHSL